MNNIDIKEIDSKEIRTISAMFRKVFAETFSEDVPEFDEVTDGERIYAAYLKGQIVGFASVWEPTQFIHFLFVNTEFRHQNIGRTLVTYLADRYGTLTLKCLVSNSNGIAFYHATGWQKVETGMSEEGEYELLRYPGRPA